MYIFIFGWSGTPYCPKCGDIVSYSRASKCFECFCGWKGKHPNLGG